MNNETIVDAIGSYVQGLLGNLYTIIPAKVIAVPAEYNNKPFVDVRPMIRTRRTSGDLYEYEDYFEVPLMTYSGNLGKAKITVPVKVGDNVLLLFSQRDTEFYLDGNGVDVQNPTSIKPLGEFPLCAIPSLFTYQTDVTVDPDNIDIVNTLSNITLKPDGNIDINGCTITPKGNVITKAGTDLDELKALHDALRAEYDLHTHTGNLGAPTSPPL